VGVVYGLLVGTVEVFASAFHFNKDGAFPKQVDIAVFIVQFLNPMLECAYPLAANAKHIKKLYHKRFGIGFFISRVSPFFRKPQSAVFYFVPA
jgi:hypothetical protein